MTRRFRGPGEPACCHLTESPRLRVPLQPSPRVHYRRTDDGHHHHPDDDRGDAISAFPSAGEARAAEHHEYGRQQQESYGDDPPQASGIRQRLPAQSGREEIPGPGFVVIGNARSESTCRASGSAFSGTRILQNVPGPGVGATGIASFMPVPVSS